MSEERRKCFNCNHYYAYYTKSFCNLTRERRGYCQRYDRITDECNNCEEWRRKRVAGKQCVALAIDGISKIYEKLAIVEQLLKEEIEIE